jgi:AcrR family transcriptional regulator
MARPTADQQIPDLADEIKGSAWRQIAENGAAALSLRAIARELGITAPAIYNYFSRRDDLVTALIVDAFHSLGQSQTDAIQDLPGNALRERFNTLGLVYRDWALTYPQRYQLIFGTPIPDYQAPREITTPAAASSLMPLINTLQSCLEAGLLRVENFPSLNDSLEGMLSEWSAVAGGVHLEVLYTALAVWSRVHGLISLEIGCQLPDQITDPGQIYIREIDFMSSLYLER